VKYTLGRIGLFFLVLLPLWPLDIDILLKLMIAVLASAGLSLFLLRNWRNEIALRLQAGVERRRESRDKLRSALAGDDEESGPDSAQEPSKDR
jgi:hypothetical protein